MDRLDVTEYVRGFSVRRIGHGYRPGPRVSDATIVALGRAVLKGEPVCTTATKLGISRRTASRWIKRLKLRQLAS